SCVSKFCGMAWVAAISICFVRCGILPALCAQFTRFYYLCVKTVHLRLSLYIACPLLYPRIRAKLPPMPPRDLSRLWEEHTKHEFETRDTEATLATMVEDAYVNHIPTLTGGNGKPALRQFYSRDFIPSMPPDTKLTPVSRTVGEDQIVDEM